jgi:HlyD family secretion protein
MHLASDNEAPRPHSSGIRDTSATDVVVEAPSKRNRYYWIGGGALGLLLLAIFVFPVLNRWLQAEVTVPLERLRIATVERGDFVRDVGVQGTIVAAISPTLFSPAQGTVTLLIQAGDTVEAGQVLATLDSPNLTSQLQQEQATLQSERTDFDRKGIEFKRRQLENQQTIDLAQVRITAAEREQRRAEAAHDAQAISLQDYEKANDDVDTARLEFAHAKQNANLEIEVMDFELRTNQLTVDRQKLLVDNLQRRVDELNIESPVTGMVGNLAVDQKSAVAENQPLLTVVDLSAFEVEMQVPESYGDDLQIGMGAEISYSGRSFEGLVTAVSPEVQNNQVTGRVRFAGEPPAGLRQNQRVSVRIVLEASNDVLMVQRGPFLDTGGGRVAYVVNDGLAERRAIQVGASSINSLEIASGLEEGEQIVISSIGQFNGVDTVYITD